MHWQYTDAALMKPLLGQIMKEERLNKKIEDQAKKFKARALKSPRDRKRHDLVRQDEKKCMSTAHHQLGWSFAKIGSVFDRDPRTAKQAVESYAARKQRAAVVSEQIGKHFDELASESEVLAHHVARLLRFKDDNNIKSLGFPPSFWWKTSGQPVNENIDPLAEFTYQQEHPKPHSPSAGTPSPCKCLCPS